MIRLKTILQSKTIYILLIFITILVTLTKINKSNNISIYNTDEKQFIGIVKEYKIDEDKITIEIKAKENIIAKYYYKNKKEVLNIKYGTYIKVIGNIEQPSNNTIPNTFNYKKYLNNKNIYNILTIDQIVETKQTNNFIYILKNKINNRLNKIDTTGYIKAFILGNKNNIDQDIYTNYQNIGITHLFALSGMHISLLSSILLKILNRLKDYKKYIILNTILITYGYIVSFPSSLKRCLTFYIINTINKVFKLKINNLNIMIVTICILIIYNYRIIYDIGFQYSSIIVTCILLGSNIIKLDKKFISALKLSLITSISSIPISLYYYHQYNFLSILYNLIFIPLISLIVYPLSLIVFIIPKINIILELLVKLMEYTSTLLSNIKLLNIYLSLNIYEILLYYLILIIIIVYKKYKYIIINILIIIVDILIPYLSSTSYVYFLDVGQGDSSLIISPYKKDIILIDTGGNPNSNYNISKDTISFLHSLSINHIDFLIITHGDADHVGEALNIINNIKVKNVILNCGSITDLEKALISALDKNNIKYYSCIKELNTYNKLYFLQTKEYDNENDNSNVIYTKIYNYKFLFMGDAGIAKEKDILEKYNLSNIDVLKVGHHGSKTSSSKEFIDSINPKISIISVGKNNRYGHPNKEVLDNLEESKIYRTDINYSMEIKLNKNGYKIKSLYP